MPALAKVQTKKVDVYQLIAESFMSEDRKEYWRRALPTMSRSQVGELVKMLLDERDRMTPEQAAAIVAEAQAAEKRMWRAAEKLLQEKDQHNADDALAALNRV